MNADQQPDRKMAVTDERMLHEGHSYAFVDLTVKYPDDKVRNKPIVRHQGAATILPLLETDDGDHKVVMVRNERVTIDGFLLELPAGGIDKDEEPIEAAARELVEETGYRAQRIEPLCQFLTTPGLTDELMHVFVAQDLEHVGQRLEPYESLSVELHEPDRVLDMVHSNEITDAKTMLTILTAKTKGLI